MFYKLVLFGSCVDLLIRAVTVSAVPVARQQVCHRVYLFNQPCQSFLDERTFHFQLSSRGRTTLWKQLSESKDTSEGSLFSSGKTEKKVCSDISRPLQSHGKKQVAGVQRRASGLSCPGAQCMQRNEECSCKISRS